jgi:hypothetical protein
VVRRLFVAPAPGLEPSAIIGKSGEIAETSGTDGKEKPRISAGIADRAADFAAGQRRGHLLDAAMADALLAMALRGMAERIAASARLIPAL